MSRAFEDKTASRAYKEQLKESNRQKANRDKVIRDLMKTGEGRDYVWWLLSIGGIYNSAMANNALHMAYNCGKQDFGREVLAHIIEVSPDGYIKLMKEKNDVQTKNADPSADDDEFET